MSCIIPPWLPDQLTHKKMLPKDRWLNVKFCNTEGRSFSGSLPRWEKRGRCQFKQLKIVFARESGRLCLLSWLITLNNFLVYVLNDIHYFSSHDSFAYLQVEQTTWNRKPFHLLLPVIHTCDILNKADDYIQIIKINLIRGTKWNGMMR